MQSVIKVSRNAPERRSGAPGFEQKAFRAPNCGQNKPERIGTLFWAQILSSVPGPKVTRFE